MKNPVVFDKKDKLLDKITTGRTRIYCHREQEGKRVIKHRGERSIYALR